MSEPGELDRLQHRLDVLLLVLQDHPEDEAVAEEPIVGVQVDAREHVERPRANVRDVVTGRVGLEQR